MSFEEKELVIILADISGYTHFMLENQTSAVHGQLCINSLIEAILEQVDIPLQLQEIEGDAVFLYAAHPGDDRAWREVLDEVSTRLGGFFESFVNAMAVASESTPCSCAICRNADKLRLKIIVHAGQAVFHGIAGRAQVSGPDVILAHRLLKNSLESEEYLLLTDAAYAAIGARLPGPFQPHTESFEGFDNVKAHVHFFSEGFDGARERLYELPEEEIRAQVRSYVRWVAGAGGKATLDQLRHPIKDFGAGPRAFMLLKLVAWAPAWFLLSLFRIPSQVVARGRRRTEWAVPKALRTQA